MRSILKCILTAIPLTCVGAHRPCYIRIIFCVQSLSCLFDFGDSRRTQVCLGPVLFIYLFISTRWELSLKPKFKGRFFARFFFPHAHFSSDHKKEKHVKVRSKGKNTVTLFGENAARDRSAGLFAALFSLPICSS